MIKKKVANLITRSSIKACNEIHCNFPFQLFAADAAPCDLNFDRKISI
jgi:hypothetical protein